MDMIKKVLEDGERWDKRSNCLRPELVAVAMAETKTSLPFPFPFPLHSTPQPSDLGSQTWL